MTVHMTETVMTAVTLITTHNHHSPSTRVTSDASSVVAKEGTRYYDDT